MIGLASAAQNQRLERGGPVDEISILSKSMKAQAIGVGVLFAAGIAEAFVGGPSLGLAPSRINKGVSRSPAPRAGFALRSECLSPPITCLWLWISQVFQTHAMASVQQRQPLNLVAGGSDASCSNPDPFHATTAAHGVQGARCLATVATLDITNARGHCTGSCALPVLHTRNGRLILPLIVSLSLSSFSSPLLSLFLSPSLSLPALKAQETDVEKVLTPVGSAPFTLHPLPPMPSSIFLPSGLSGGQLV